MKITFLNLFLIICFILSACNHNQIDKVGLNQKGLDNQKNGFPTLETYYNLINYVGDSDFSIESSEMLNSPSGSTQEITGFITDKTTKQNLKIGNAQFGSLSVNTIDSRNIYGTSRSNPKAAEGLFGTTFNFDIPSPNQLSGSGFKGQLYLPKQLIIQNPTAYNLQKLNKQQNLIIRWNSDVANQGGVVIMVSYSHSFSNPNPNEDIPPFVFAEVVPDNGTFTINKSVFANIPDEHTIDINIIRGGYKLYSNPTDQRTYRVWGYSKVIMSYQE
jgi:hypothetical protein